MSFSSLGRACVSLFSLQINAVAMTRIINISNCIKCAQTIKSGNGVENVEKETGKMGNDKQIRQYAARDKHTPKSQDLQKSRFDNERADTASLSARAQKVFEPFFIGIEDKPEKIFSYALL